jgi:hypothetical protein
MASSKSPVAVVMSDEVHAFIRPAVAASAQGAGL